MEKEIEDNPRRGRRTTPDRDWTKGSIIGNLWSLSWPMIIAGSLNMAGPTIDMIWVGKLGAAAIAGVGVAGIAVQVLNAAMMGLATGLRAMIARFMGADDTESANHVARQGFAVSAVFSIIVAVIGALLAESILMMFGLEADVVAEGAAYMRIMFVGAAAMSFRMMTEGIMQSSGDTVTPMKITVFLRIFHVTLCPFLIFGWWIFPRFGVSGAALTNVISQSLGLTLALWILFSGRTRVLLTLSNFRFDLNIIWRMVKIGIPAALTTMQSSVLNLVYMWIIVPFGTLAVAAHTLSQRVEMFIQMPGMGFGQAAGVLAGQNLGAGQPERAERSGWLAMAVLMGIKLVGSVVIWLWAESIVRIFSSDPGIVEIASTFLRIAIPGFLALGIVSTSYSWLNGVGDTLPPMLISLVSMWLVRLPLAYFLTRFTDIGVYGVRWAIVAGFVSGAIAYLIYLRSGKWKHKKV